MTTGSRCGFSHDRWPLRLSIVLLLILFAALAAAVCIVALPVGRCMDWRAR